MTHADDMQIYLILDPSKCQEGVSRLEKCVSDVKAWTVQNKLKQNDSKMEIIHLSSRFVKTPSLPPVTIAESVIDVCQFQQETLVSLLIIHLV